MKNIKYYLKLALILLLISGITSALLGFVNTITADKIAALKSEKTQEAMEFVMPGFNSSVPIEASGEKITAVYEAYQDSDLLGYIVQVEPSGFGGTLSMIVGIGTDCKVTGVSITEHSETAGLGAKASNPDWLSQYVGLGGHINVNTATSKGGDNAIDAVTSASVTSRAVTSGVNAAISLVESLNAG